MSYLQLAKLGKTIEKLSARLCGGKLLSYLKLARLGKTIVKLSAKL